MKSYLIMLIFNFIIISYAAAIDNLAADQKTIETTKVESEKKELTSRVLELTEIKEKLQKSLEDFKLKILDIESANKSLSLTNEELLVDNKRVNSMLKVQQRRIEDLEAKLNNQNIKITKNETDLSLKIQALAKASQEVAILRNDLKKQQESGAKYKSSNCQCRDSESKLLPDEAESMHEKNKTRSGKN